MPTYATWNPSDIATSYVYLSGSNLVVNRNGTSSGSYGGGRSTIGVSSGKYYWEITINNDTYHNVHLGIGTTGVSIYNHIGMSSNGRSYYAGDGRKWTGGNSSSYGDAYNPGDVVSIALDMDNGKVWFGKNGTWQNSGDPANGTGHAFSGLSGTFYAMFTLKNNGDKITANFGASAFSYTVPTGFNSGLYEATETEVLEDISLDLSTNAQSLEDLGTWLRAHDGLEFEDFKSALEASAYEIEDLATYLSAYFQSLEDMGLGLDTWGTGYEDLKMRLDTWATSYEDLKSWLSAYYQSLEHWKTFLWAAAWDRKDFASNLQAYGRELQDLPSFLRAVGYRTEDLNGYFEAVSPTVLASLGLFLTITDGVTLSDLCVNLTAIKKSPQFRSVVAQRVSSVVSEVV